MSQKVDKKLQMRQKLLNSYFYKVKGCLAACSLGEDSNKDKKD